MGYGTDPWGPSPPIFRHQPSRGVVKGGEKKTSRANLRLSLAQKDTPSQIFFAKNRIFKDKTAVAIGGYLNP